jgi:hypothetical protein
MAKPSIRFGELAPRIDEQLQDQGLRLDMDPYDRAILQRNCDSITQLVAHKLLTDREADAARKRIMQIIRRNAVHG